MRKSVLRRILGYVRPYRFFVIGALLFAILSVGLTLLSPIWVGQAIDALIGPGQVNFDKVLSILPLLGATIGLSALFQWLMALCTQTVSARTAKDLRKAAFDKIAKAPLKTLDRQPHGETLYRIINDVESVSDGLLQGFTQLFAGIAAILGTLVFMLMVSPVIAAVVVLLTPLSLFVASFIAKHSHSMFVKQSMTQGELGGFVSEMLGEQKVVKTFGYEKKAQQRFEEINGRLQIYGQKAQFYSSVTNPCTRFVNGLVFAAVGIFGAINVIGGRLSIGQLSSFLSYANQYTKPFNEISGVVTQLQTAFAGAQRLLQWIDEPCESSDEKAKPLETPCQGAVTLSDVSFSYTKDKPLIKHLSLTVKPGQTIAIVGPTGCGKTTLMNLLMRFYEVLDGTISVDGTDIKELRRNDLRQQYGMVLQESWLFAGSIYENIAYGNPAASRDEVKAAAKAAYAHPFIKNLPEGYETRIEDGGGNLSEGQKQLLCIARVMVCNPPMLILDEATSSVDTLTEKRLNLAFSAMMQGKTGFVVAHRLSTIQEADHILVMKDGDIIEQGTHEQLLAKRGFYAYLLESQFKRP